MQCEIQVKVKDDEKTLRKDFVIYDPVMVSSDDPVVAACIKDVLDNFKGEPTDISVKFLLEVT